jgi:hypothetical protein
MVRIGFATKTKHELDWYCKKHPSVMQFHNKGDALYHWNVGKNRGLVNHTQISDVVAEPRAPKTEQAKTKRSLLMKRNTAMASQLVVSTDVQHSAKGLCESDSSHGPDFVSVPRDCSVIWEPRLCGCSARKMRIRSLVSILRQRSLAASALWVEIHKALNTRE